MTDKDRILMPTGFAASVPDSELKSVDGNLKDVLRCLQAEIDRISAGQITAEKLKSLMDITDALVKLKKIEGALTFETLAKMPLEELAALQAHIGEEIASRGA